MTTVGQPPRRTIAAFTSYVDAQHPVELLADQDCPIAEAAIIARDLHEEERPQPITRGRGALVGAAEGAGLGGLFSLLAVILAARGDLGLALIVMYGMTFAGALLGALAGALTSGTAGHDAASIGSVRAESYEVVVDEDVADRALDILRLSDRAPCGGDARAPAAKAAR